MNLYSVILEMNLLFVFELLSFMLIIILFGVIGYGWWNNLFMIGKR